METAMQCPYMLICCDFFRKTITIISEASVAIEVFSVSPSLEAKHKSFWIDHPLDPKISFIEYGKNFFAHTKMSDKTFYFVV